jgi:alkylated DNA repair dioxygenase AlkB
MKCGQVYRVVDKRLRTSVDALEQAFGYIRQFNPVTVPRFRVVGSSIRRMHLKEGSRSPEAPVSTIMILPKKDSGISLYDPNFISQADADRLQAGFLKLKWKQHIMKMHGREVSMPRMYQWMGIAPTIYGEGIVSIEWTPEASEVQRQVHAATGLLFNSLNINLYRHENDHIGWHSDGEDEGSWEFPIASVSLGAIRDFQVCPYLGNGKLKRRFHKYFGEPDQPVALAHGSLVVMPAGSQEFYVHRLKKATKRQGTGARINLTFRMMSGS